MFGYVRIFKPELKIREFDQYQGVYCSLCRRLGKKYGFVARMSLSYDFTFLALLGMALSDTCTGFQKGRCPYNPLKKRLCCSNDPAALEYATDAAALLLYYKLQDNARDEGFWKRAGARWLLWMSRRSHRKAAAARPELDRHIACCMERQAALEAAKTASIDQAAEPSADMLSALARGLSDDPVEQRVLERFGYCLGRWVYLMDACDDLEDDLEHTGYNPYALARGLRAGDAAGLRQAREYAAGTLNACLAECVADYQLLTIRRFGGILTNILEWGMPAAQRQVLARKTDKGQVTDDDKSL